MKKLSLLLLSIFAMASIQAVKIRNLTLDNIKVILATAKENGKVKTVLSNKEIGPQKSSESFNVKGYPVIVTFKVPSSNNKYTVQFLKANDSGNLVITIDPYGGYKAQD